jgi:hypothetical protein
MIQYPAKLYMFQKRVTSWLKAVKREEFCTLLFNNPEELFSIFYFGLLYINRIRNVIHDLGLLID